MKIEEALDHLINGRAILFAGAGFSYGAVNILNNNFLNAKELAYKLCELGAIEEDEDLGYVSNEFLKKHSVSELINILEDEFITKETRDYHKNLAKLPWKRIYTTNYDDVIERAATYHGIKKKSVTITSKPTDVINKKDLVIHFNGYIHNLSAESLNSEFKLTNSSYLTDDFLKSDWKNMFLQDVHAAKAIFFIGYSLEYDLDIQRILASNKDLKSKCFFITGEKIKEKTKNIMSSYGEILSIGVEGFSQKVTHYMETTDVEDIGEYYLTSFKTIRDNELEIKPILDKEVFDLLFSGEINIDHVKYSNQTDRIYFVEREIINDIEKSIQNEPKQLYILHSDLGNGKTGVMQSLYVKLSSYNVFFFDRYTSELINDLEYISQQKGKKIIFIENYYLYLNILKTFSTFKTEDTIYIVSCRSLINDTRYNQIINALDIPEDMVEMRSVNELTDNEKKQFIKIADTYHLWGQYTAYNSYQKYKLLKDNLLQNYLIKIIKSPEIHNRFLPILTNILNNQYYRELMISAFISDTLGFDLKMSELIYLMDLQYPTVSLLNDYEVREIIDIEEDRVHIKSAILSGFFLGNSNVAPYVVEILCKFATKVSESARTDSKYFEIGKQLVNFSNLKLIIKSTKSELKRDVTIYYEKVKNLHVNKEDPYFWLHYAIGCLELREFGRAAKYFDNAYAYAKSSKRIVKFNTFQIDTHYARYILEKHIAEPSTNSHYAVFEEAHNLIISNKNKDENLHYPLRITVHYYDFYVKYYSELSNEEQTNFVISCYQIRERIDNYFNYLNKINRKYKHPQVIIAYDKINIILKSISKSGNKEIHSGIKKV